MIFYIILVLIITCLLFKFFNTKPFEKFEPQSYGNIVKNMRFDFKSDDLSLNRFFDFSGIYAKFYPKTKKIVNDYYKVPVVV
jgi:hypothetical protein